LETFAKLTGTCIEDLQKLNPSVLHGALPATGKTYPLNISMEAKYNLVKNRMAILDSASRVGRKELELLAKNTEGSTYGRDHIVYKVRSGDVLGSIAIRYGVRTDDLRKWNNIHKNNIRAGQHLNIWAKGTHPKALIASDKNIPAQVPGSKTYTVQSGDTLWTISRKFEGLTIDKLKSLNKMSNNKIQPGQKLIVGI
jgi:membrane-bound lytic murein transglycosylase D